MMQEHSPTRSRVLGWLGILLVLAVAAALRLWRIDSIPPGFHFDESFEGLEAWRILTDPGYRPIFLMGNFGVPPLNAYANALMFGLFSLVGADVGPTAMRVTAAIFGVLGVASVYLLAMELRKLDGSDTHLSTAFALLAAAFLAVMRWHIHFSRMGIEPIIVPLIWAASTWMLLRGWRTGRWLPFIGCGVVLAAGMYTYQGAWIVPILMVIVALLLLVDRRSIIADEKAGIPDETWPNFSLQTSILRLFVAAGVAALLVLPLVWFFVRNPDLLLLRPAQLAIVGETESPADSGIWQNVLATAKMFGPLGSPGDLDPRRNLPGMPALNLWLVFPFFCGLLLTVRHLLRSAYAIPLIGLIGLLLPGVFSEYAPHFHRVLGAAAPVALIGGMGLDWFWSWPWLRRWHLHWLVVGLLILGGMTSARNYFSRWSTLPDLYYAFDSGLWELAQWVETQPDDATFYLTPRSGDHPTLAFAWRNRLESAPISFDGRYVFPVAQGKTSIDESYVVIEHEDFRTRLLLPEVLPDAVITKEFTDGDGAVYARVYSRPAETMPARPPRWPIEQMLGDGVALAGYDRLPETPSGGDVLYVQLHWDIDATPQGDWTVYIHVIDPATDEVVAGHDSRPGNNTLPTVRWQAGWRVLDEYQLLLPADLQPGEYELQVGLYDALERRLPIEGDGIDLGRFMVD